MSPFQQQIQYHMRRKQKRIYTKKQPLTIENCIDHNGQLIGKTGKWTEEETVAYFRFLLDERLYFQMPGQRKKNHIFLKMSAAISTRTPEQCRSHHQKTQLFAQTKQAIGICYFILEKLRAYPIHKQLEEQLDKAVEQMGSTKGNNAFQIRSESFSMIGNNRGSYNLMLNVQQFECW